MMISLLLLLWAGSASSKAPVVAATDLANLRDIGGHARGSINISPDERWVVFQLQTPRISAGGYELTWMALSTQGEHAFPIADGGKVLLNPALDATPTGNRPPVRAKWSPDSRSFAYLLRRDGQTQIWLSRPDRKGRVQLTHNAGDVIEFAWSHDGSKLYFKAGLDRTEIEMRMSAEGARGFLFDDRFHPRVTTQPIFRDCGGAIYKRKLVSLARDCEPAIWIYDFKTRKERLATNKDVEKYNRLHDRLIAPEALQGRSYTHLRRWAEGTRYAWLENIDPKTYSNSYAPLTIFALVDNKIRRCIEEVCRDYQPYILDLWWRQTGQEVVFLRRDGPTYSQLGLYAWSPSTGGLRRILQADGWLSDCTPAGDRLICLYETSTQPRKIVSASLEDGSIKTIFDPNLEFARLRVPKIEKLEWKDAYGNPTFGHLVYPVNYDPEHDYPLVIVTYRSRGFLRGGTGDEFPIYPLAAEGFFVLSHDMPTNYARLAKTSNTAIKIDEVRYRRKTTLSAQEIIIERLAGADLIDKTRVAITGLSDGAAQVGYALTHSDIDFATAIATYIGSFSSSLYYMDNEHYRALWRSTQFNGLLPDDPDSGLKETSIGLNAARITTPLLINTSDAEMRASVENVIRLEEANKPVAMYVFPEEYHIKWKPNHRLAVYRRNIQWLKFWLLGETEGDPVAPSQYDRWIDLCRLHVQNLQSNSESTPCVSNVMDAPVPH